MRLNKKGENETINYPAEHIGQQDNLIKHNNYGTTTFTIGE
jgi:hypothetical protein